VFFNISVILIVQNLQCTCSF